MNTTKPKRPMFAVLLCRMANGTVSKLRTHRLEQAGEGEAATIVYKPLPLSPRQHAIIHRAERITAPDINGNASRQTNRRHEV